jgi:hypothetical protein
MNTIIAYNIKSAGTEINVKKQDDYPKEEPYLVYRYKIVDKHFVKTDYDTLLLKKFSKAENIYAFNAAFAVCNFLAHQKNWTQYRFVPSSN